MNVYWYLFGLLDVSRLLKTPPVGGILLLEFSTFTLGLDEHHIWKAPISGTPIEKIRWVDR